MIRVIETDLDMSTQNFANFHLLPDETFVPVKVFPVIAGIAVSTAWRRAKLEPDFPKPVRLGQRCTRFRLGDIRRFLAEREAGAVL